MRTIGNRVGDEPRGFKSRPLRLDLLSQFVPKHAEIFVDGPFAAIERIGVGEDRFHKEDMYSADECVRPLPGVPWPLRPLGG